LPGSNDGTNGGASTGGQVQQSNLVDIKLSAAPANVDEAKSCGC
jgi:hypothetical protein